MAQPTGNDSPSPQEINNAAFGSEPVAHSREYRAHDLRYEGAIVAEYFAPGKSVLDLGCGYGRTTVALARLGYRVVGADIVPKMIEAAKAANPEIDYRVMDACRLGFAAESFDYVLFSFNGLDFVLPEERRVEALIEIFRVLKPGGIFVCNSHSWLPYLFNPRLWKTKKFATLRRNGALERRCYSAGVEGMPLSCFIATPGYIRAQLRRAGFVNVRIRPGQRPSGRLARLFVLPTWCLDLWPHFISRKPDR